MTKKIIQTASVLITFILIFVLVFSIGATYKYTDTLRTVKGFDKLSGYSVLSMLTGKDDLYNSTIAQLSLSSLLLVSLVFIWVPSLNSNNYSKWIIIALYAINIITGLSSFICMVNYPNQIKGVNNVTVNALSGSAWFIFGVVIPSITLGLNFLKEKK